MDSMKLKLKELKEELWVGRLKNILGEEFVFTKDIFAGLTLLSYLKEAELWVRGGIYLRAFGPWYEVGLVDEELWEDWLELPVCWLLVWDWFSWLGCEELWDEVVKDRAKLSWLNGWDEVELWDWRWCCIEVNSWFEIVVWWGMADIEDVVIGVEL